jgi:hypothetical protein
MRQSWRHDREPFVDCNGAMIAVSRLTSGQSTKGFFIGVCQMDNTLYSARKIIYLMGIKNQPAKFLRRKMLKIPTDVVEMKVLGSSHFGRPALDYLLTEGAAKHLFLLCNDGRRAESRISEVSEDMKKRASEILEKSIVKQKTLAGKRQYYPMNVLYVNCKIRRAYSTWVNDIKRRNKKRVISKNEPDDLHNFLLNVFDIYVKYEDVKKGRKKIGRPKIINAFVSLDIAEYEAMRYGKKIDRMHVGPSDWLAVNYLKIPRGDINEMLDKPRDFDDRIEDADEEW